MTDLVDLLAKEYTYLETELLLTDGTPQHRAVSWLAHEDEWTRDALMNPDIPIQMIGERYALTVLYYATEGDQWFGESHEFLSSASVCNWTAVGTDDVLSFCLGEGVSCNDDDFVASLTFSKLPPKIERPPGR